MSDESLIIANEIVTRLLTILQPRIGTRLNTISLCYFFADILDDTSIRANERIADYFRLRSLLGKN